MMHVSKSELKNKAYPTIQVSSGALTQMASFWAATCDATSLARRGWCYASTCCTYQILFLL